MRVLSRSRVGYRGGFLLILSFVDVMYGWSLVDPSREARRAAAYVWRELYAPPWVWGGMWVLVGLVAFVSAFAEHDGVGYGAAIGWDVLWGLIAGASWVAGGVDRGWVTTVIWGAAAGWAALASSWAEPVKVTAVTALRMGEMDVPDLPDLGDDQ
jgi:hypothetical protein